MIEEAKHKEQLRQIEKDKRLAREEKLAKLRVKEQIEADKKARREKAEQDRLARLGQAPPAAAAVSAPAAPKAASSANHTTARVQIRPSSIPGAPANIVKTLPAIATMHDLAQSLVADGLTGYSVDRAKFMQVYPRKEYSRSDWGKQLKDLGGLVPSGTVMLLLD